MCGRHGGQTGPMVCEHIGRDAHRMAGSMKVPADSVLRLYLDVLEDGAEQLEHFFCPECASRYGLTSMKRIPHEVWDSKDRFPDVAPVCRECFREWMAPAAP